MKDRNVQGGVLLLICLQLTGVCCERDAVFIFSAVGSDVLLPCSPPEGPGCSQVSWTFFGGRIHSYEVRDGQLSGKKASRMSLLSNCSLVFRDLMLEDVGTYTCLTKTKSTSNVFLSLLSMTSVSQISELRPSGTLVLSCVLFTYYDAGNCARNHSRNFRLYWAMEDGAELPADDRYKLTDPTPCNITLVIQLKKEDNNRKWRCQVKTAENGVSIIKEFTSAFLFHEEGVSVGPPPQRDCPVQLPISRVVLCVVLPLMVITVGVFSWRRDRVNANVSKFKTDVQEVI
ncbi:uncharacterized protein LOC103378310 [Cynoglossus semilaevis]|uniref:uncharacterized protein LOC103378310 n=1 Tax=Cynoglossus semilaevis TaxID=244447 RepID=UPI0007DCA5E0|nr:uncharacterized protein LOC103378310 [Cynoglossus semilaevis]